MHMQAHSRGITLDQLHSPTNGGIDTIPGESALIHSELAAAHNPLALLDRMLSALTPSNTRHTIARNLVTLARQAAGMDLCVVMLTERVQGVGVGASRRLSIQASSPDLNGQTLAVPPLEIEADLWEKLRQPGVAGQLPALDIREQDMLNPLDNVAYGSLFIVPLIAGSELVGLLYGYTSSVRDLAAQELLILQAIGNYAAMTIASRTLLDAAQSSAPLHALFDGLLSDNPAQEDALRGCAASLGYNVTLPSTIVLVKMVGTSGENERYDKPGKQDGQDTKNDRHTIFSRALTFVHARIQEQYPVSLIDTRDLQLRCIITIEQDEADHLVSWLTSLVQQIESDYDAQLFAGISSTCSGIRDYRRGFAEAQEALQIGECLHRRAGCLPFSRLGAYRYLYPFAHDQRLSDPYLDHVETIVRYDRNHKRGNLIRSLETYLALGGNIKEAAEQLKVHRNTLTQRLERIQSLCDVNLDRYDERFSLQLALMIHRLR